MPQSSTRHRLAQTTLRLYPRAWRDRYEDEVAALLNDAGCRWRDVFDLARGALAQWRVELLDPERHRFVAWVWIRSVWYFPTALVAVLMYAVPRNTSLALRREFGEPGDWLPAAALLLLVGIAAWGLGHQIRATRRFRYRSRADAAVCVLLTLTAWSIVRWSDPDNSSPRWLQIYTYFCVAQLCLIGRRRPAHVRALDSTAALREQLKWAQLEQTRLESLPRTLENDTALESARLRVQGLRNQLLDAFDVIRLRPPSG